MEGKRQGLLGCFLRERVGEMLMLCAFGAITWVVLALYDLETEPVLYAGILCALLYLLLLAIRFVRYGKTAKARRALLRSADEGETRNAHAATTLAEREYRAGILALEERCRTLATQQRSQQQESLDYYTTWVHQIKTPIAAMRMQLQGEDTEENRALLAELFRIEQYVEMVLSYIRLGSSQSDFVFQEYEVDEIIRKAIRKFAPQFVRKRIKLSYEPTALRVVTDEKWLLFILEQLLSNALKYTSAGTITIAVSLACVLSVTDTGIGIAPEDLPRIFEKGFTGYNGRADQKATGLGLYLCKQTADRLGFALSAQSTPGVGSTFCLTMRQNKLVVE
jgi:hypothetical protein